MRKRVLMLCVLILLADPIVRAQQDGTLPVPASKITPPKPPPRDFGRPLELSIDEAGAGDYSRAIVDAEDSLTLAEQQLGPNDETVAHILHILASYQLLSHQNEGARSLLGRELRIEGKPNGPKDVDLAEAKALSESAQSLEFADTPKAAQAAQLLELAVKLNERIYGRDSPYVAASVFALATNMILQKKLAQAEPLYKRALAIFEQDPGSKANVLVVLNDLASVYMQQKRYPDAEPLLTRGLALAEKESSPDSSTSKEIRQQLAKLYAETARKREANANVRASEKRP